MLPYFWFRFFFNPYLYFVFVGFFYPYFLKKMSIPRKRTISTKIVLVTCYPLCILKSFDTRSHWDIFFHCGVIYQWWKFFVGIEHFCLFKLKFGCDAILFLLVSKTLRVLDVVQLTAVCGTRAAKKSIKVLRSYSIRSQLIFSDFAYQLRFELNAAVKRKSF